MKTFAINGRLVGQGYPYVIAEIGINHGGDLATAKRLLSAARQCGVDAAKLQAFVPEKFLARSSPYFDLLASCALKPADIRELMRFARDLELTLFSAVFDEESADLLQEAGAPAFKIASGDITHVPLLRHVARFGKPMLISTGGATMAETEAAVATVRDVGSDIPVAVLHCVSNYPTQPADANLACMATMRRQLGIPVGFSDHTLGSAVSIAAAAMGADLIEKHFTLDRGAEGPDHALSLDPAGMAALVNDVRHAFDAIGNAGKAPVEAAEHVRAIRRSVVASCDIPQGTTIESTMLAIKRPGTGIAPADMKRVIGRVSVRNIDADTALDWNMLRTN